MKIIKEIIITIKRGLPGVLIISLIYLIAGALLLLIGMELIEHPMIGFPIIVLIVLFFISYLNGMRISPKPKPPEK